MKLRYTLLAMLTVTASAFAPVATASESDGIALFDGKRIDLRHGWGDATACNVDGDITTCYRTRGEADAAIGYDARDEATTGIDALPDCASGWMCLYEHVDGGGRRLIFNDEYWHELNDWGFRDTTSSIRNRQACADKGSLLDFGWQFVVDYEGCAYYSQLGATNDRSDQVHG